MASVYILYSNSAKKFYVGVTKDINQRIKFHESKHFSSSFTAAYNDWELFLELPNISITTALLIERHIKKMKSKIYIQNLKKYPEIVEKLMVKYEK
ncbi:MAG: GIY-YIG nuclease family protein [Bacteroidia bacterium]